MNKHSPTESDLYAQLGVSSSKAGVQAALGLERSTFFCPLQADCCGDPLYLSALHADGAGTKSIVAYLAFRETGEPRWFRSLAQDSLIMNIDDLACVNALENLTVCNTIGRNRRLIPDAAIQEIIAGYRETAAALTEDGIPVRLSGGETADIGDLVRTLVVDSAVLGRVKKNEVISTDNIMPGDIIVGLSSTGQSRGEAAPNSGIGSNGLTLARHALLSKHYAASYPEALDSHCDSKNVYSGPFKLSDTPSELGMSLASALLSPTRSYAALIKEVLAALGSELHGAIHCTGGGQTKILKFGRGCCYLKDNLFPVPPLFALIQKTTALPWSEMYTVFNMGHRLELLLPERRLAAIQAIAAQHGIEARRIGSVIAAQSANQLILKTPFGEFSYA